MTYTSVYCGYMLFTYAVIHRCVQRCYPNMRNYMYTYVYYTALHINVDYVG